MRKPNLYLTLVAMVAMLTVSLGVSSVTYGYGLDKTQNNMYASLREKETSNIIYINTNNTKDNSIKKVLNSNNKKVSNYVTNLLDKKLTKTVVSSDGATALTYRYVKARASRAGWGPRQWNCLSKIIYRESRWNPHSKNKTSSAYGLFQILKLPVGTPVREQTERGIRYIKSRYGDPCTALNHHDRYNWY